VYLNCAIPVIRSFILPLPGRDSIEATFGQGKPDYQEDATGILKYVNRRAEQWWQLREMLAPATGLNVALPPDEQLRADLTAPTYKLTSRGLLIESKEDLQKRLHRSPDRGDAGAYVCNARSAFRST